MKKTILLACAFITVNAFVSCTKTETPLSCPVNSIAKVLKVDGSTSIEANKELVLTVSFEGHNGCVALDNFSETTTDNVTEICTVTRYNSEPCIQVFVTVNASYTFKRSSPGVYVLKFSQPDKSFITHTVTVK